jgi:hypothetical protein
MFFHIPFFNLLLIIAFTHKYGVKDLGGPIMHLPFGIPPFDSMHQTLHFFAWLMDQLYV